MKAKSKKLQFKNQKLKAIYYFQGQNQSYKQTSYFAPHMTNAKFNLQKRIISKRLHSQLKNNENLFFFLLKNQKTVQIIQFLYSVNFAFQWLLSIKSTPGLSGS